jgi:diaminohydroxyphosphoribosylaminopyrimidine deaminase / 5-amino-6-(5-phosphoribosylamino)uracil reductase
MRRHSSGAARFESSVERTYNHLYILYPVSSPPHTPLESSPVSFREQDIAFMRTALSLAERGRGCVEPNPVVGAVIVCDDQVVARGWHGELGGPHAEVFAVREAGDAARGATLYVTLEPCAHHGRTPPCAPMLADAGIARLIVPTLDPTEKTCGRGVALCRERGIDVQVGLCREDAVQQNAAFFKHAATGRPLVTAKWAMTLDGKLATRTGSSRWISGSSSRQVAHELRAAAECIIVGRRTATLDDPLLTNRDAGGRRQPARLVVCGGRAIAPEAQLVQTAGESPVLLAYVADSPPDGLQAVLDAGCLPVPLPCGASAELPDLTALIDELGARGMTSVLVEGGGALLGAFFDDGLVDRVAAFIAPRIVGGADAVTPVAGSGIAEMPDAVALHHQQLRTIGNDVLIEAWVVDPMTWAV